MPEPVRVSRQDAHRSVLAPPRGLRAEERALIDFLLHEPFPGRDQLRRQLESARVEVEVEVDVEGAGGGPTIGIVPDRGAEATPDATVTVPVGAEGRDGDGMPNPVALHAPDGYLRELEIVRFDGESPRAMPIPASLRRRINGT